MSKQLYFKLPFSKAVENEIRELHSNSNNENLVFYIDLAGINKAAFNPSVVIQEIEDGEKESYFINDLKKFIIKIYKAFSDLSPKIVIFFDNSGSKQNKDIDPNYKAQRVSVIKTMVNTGQITQEEGDKYNLMKTNYHAIIEQKINIPGKIVTLNLLNYESDLVAHYCIAKNKFENATNIIFAIDKDLLQTLNYPNTYLLNFWHKGHVSGYTIYNDRTAVAKIYPELDDKLKKYGYSGIDDPNHNFTSRSIPFILSLMGDKSDNVPQLWPRLGIVTALDLFKSANLHQWFNDYDNMVLTGKLKDAEPRFKLNLELVDFDLQIKRLPKEITSIIDDKIDFLKG